MRKDEIQVIGVANMSDIAYSIDSEEKALALVLEIDKSREHVGFTEDVIIALIKAMKKEYKGLKQEYAEFKELIQGAL